MKLFYYCSSCKKENAIQIKSDNRYEFQKEIGDDEVVVNCTNCGKTDKKHVNRFHAKPRYYISLIALVCSILATLYLRRYGWISSLIFYIPVAVWRREQKRASAFNSVMIPR